MCLFCIKFRVTSEPFKKERKKKNNSLIHSNFSHRKYHTTHLVMKIHNSPKKISKHLPSNQLIQVERENERPTTAAVIEILRKEVLFSMCTHTHTKERMKKERDLVESICIYCWCAKSAWMPIGKWYIYLMVRMGDARNTKSKSIWALKAVMSFHRQTDINCVICI